MLGIAYVIEVLVESGKYIIPAIQILTACKEISDK